MFYPPKNFMRLWRRRLTAARRLWKTLSLSEIVIRSDKETRTERMRETLRELLSVELHADRGIWVWQLLFRFSREGQRQVALKKCCQSWQSISKYTTKKQCSPWTTTSSSTYKALSYQYGIKLAITRIIIKKLSRLRSNTTVTLVCVYRTKYYNGMEWACTGCRIATVLQDRFTLPHVQSHLERIWGAFKEGGRLRSNIAG